MDMSHPGLAYHKCGTVARRDAWRRSRPSAAEQRVIDAVRAEVFRRDPVCRAADLGGCYGRLQWCHMAGHRRSETRRMPPEDRHAALWTLALCACHAEQEERHIIRVRYLSNRQCNGPVRFVRSGA